MFDLVVIGSGPGGYVAAIRAAQLGLQVALVEKDAQLGGTCLNVGCIPSKTLLSISEHYHAAAHHFADIGIRIENLAIDVPTMQTKRAAVVKTTAQGVEMLLRKNKVDVLHGTASLAGPNKIMVSPAQGEPMEVQARHILIATGSRPATLPFVPQHPRVLTSTECLELQAVPKSLVVLGGGVIGIELGSVWARLGTQVSVVEAQPKILGPMDADCSKTMQKILTKQLGMEFHLRATVEEVQATDAGVRVRIGERFLDAEYLLVAAGRKPCTDGLNLEAVGLSPDERGRIPVNSQCQTTVPNIYAIGDVVRGPMLAHKAEEEGMAVAELLAGQPFHLNYATIPAVVYTHPEFAAVGATEEELKEAGKEYKAGRFPYRASGRARASDELDGMVKILGDAATGEVLGVHIVGPRAADLIMEAVIAMEFRATAEDLARICHPHPTFSEAVREASMDVLGRVLHT